MSRVSILVVSFNTREMTLACIRSVFEQTERTEFELIVIDNASSDGSAEAISAEFGGRLRLIVSTDNVGFAAANNEASQQAGGTHLLLLNPDTVILDGAIDRLVEFAEANPEAGIWGGRTVFADGSLNPASCWRRPTAMSMAFLATGLSSVFPRSPLFNWEAYGGWDRSTVRAVDIVSGCFFLIRRELWDCLGGFDTAFFMYGEEADLCARAVGFGAIPIVTPEATIVHYGGASERVRSDKLVRLLTAKALLIRRHWPVSRRQIGVVLLACWPLSRSIACTLLAALVPGQREAASAWRSVWARRAEWLAVE